MDDRKSADDVLLAIFNAAGRNADIAVDDSTWMAKVQAAQRQDAVETLIGTLAQSQFIRRGTGTVAITARGLTYIYAHSKQWRNAA